jgi:hypothetical protein
VVDLSERIVKVKREEKRRGMTKIPNSDKVGRYTVLR